MDELVFQHMLSMYGINPNMTPLPLQFPKVPPGFNHPSFVTSVTPQSAPKNTSDESINTKLQDFHQMYQKFASGLLKFNQFGVLPPGHPLHSRHNSIETLKLENGKLQKENLELRKQLDSFKDKSRHSTTNF